MRTIFYAVIALKTGAEVATVAAELEKSDELKPIAAWLRTNEGALYGRSREDWKPFMDGESIRDILTDDPRIYSSVTGLIDDQIDDAANDVTVLTRQKVDLYIIDVFALFLPRFRNLASRMDSAVSLTNGKCCLIIPYVISSDFRTVRDGLMASYRGSWAAVYQDYIQRGSLSRMIIAPDDFRNFRQHLVSLLPISDANPATVQIVSDRFLGPQTRSEVPRTSTR